MRNHAVLLVATLVGVSLLLAFGARGRSAQPDFPTPYTTDFRLETLQFIATGGNAHFSLMPNRYWRYQGYDGAEFVRLDIRVLPDTLQIPFTVRGVAKMAHTRIVEEKEWIDNELVEISRNYLARDQRGNIFYFGEDVDIYEGGVIVGHDGSWRAGVDGALPGLLMPELFLLGARYHQEIAPGVALDRAENVKMAQQVTTPLGLFQRCVIVKETTPLEPGAVDWKVYAPGVGMVQSNSLKLVQFTP